VTADRQPKFNANSPHVGSVFLSVSKKLKVHNTIFGDERSESNSGSENAPIKIMVDTSPEFWGLGDVRSSTRLKPGQEFVIFLIHGRASA